MGRALILAAAALAASMEAAAAETLRLSPGKSATLEFAENPSTGFRWRIDAKASRGLDRVAIEDGGARPGARMPGAPGTRRWTIRALKPGAATVQFAYRRPWEPAPVKTRRVEVEISR